MFSLVTSLDRNDVQELFFVLIRLNNFLSKNNIFLSFVILNVDTAVTEKIGQNTD